MEIQFFQGKKFWKNGEYFKRSNEYLHRVVWQHHNGPIPDNCHIHHKDRDKSNNDISNLECISAEQHREEHKEEKRKRFETDEGKATAKKWREKGNEWNRSNEGREFNRRRMVEIQKERPLIDLSCHHCLEPFKAKNSFAKFCSPKCYHSDRRIRRLDHCEKKCVICKGYYVARIHSQTSTCSPKCRGKLRSLRANDERSRNTM